MASRLRPARSVSSFAPCCLETRRRLGRAETRGPVARQALQHVVRAQARGVCRRVGRDGLVQDRLPRPGPGRTSSRTGVWTDVAVDSVATCAGAGPAPESAAGRVPRTTRTRWASPSSRRGIAEGSAGAPSSSALGDAAALPFRVLDLDGVARPAEPPLDRAGGPRGRNAGVHREGGPAALQPEDPFHRDAIHPAGRPRVPGPAAAPAVRRVVVDVGGHGVGLRPVRLDVARAPRVVDRVEHVEELHRLVAAPEPGQGEDDPLRRVRVLPPVLADPRQVALDVPGVEGRPVEGRRQEQDDAGRAPHQVGEHGVHGALGALRRRRAGEDGPALRDGVDPPLVVLGRPERRAVVEVPAAVPVAVPALLEHRPEPLALGAVARRPRRVAPLVAEGRERAEDGVEEPADEDALAPPFVADAVVAVVPVAAPDQREPVHAGREAAVDRPEAVIEHRPGLARDGRHPEGLGLPGRQERGLEEPDPLVEDRGVPGGPHVVGDPVRQPEQVVRAAGPYAAAARGVPPVLDVSLHELARRRPDEVLARQVRPRQGQGEDVLDLVPESVRPARLVVARARPEAARDILVEEPPVDEEVEGVVRRRDANGPERLVPGRLHRGELGLGGRHARCSREPPQEARGLRQVVPLPENEDDAPRLARPELDHRPERRARVEAGAETTRERGRPSAAARASEPFRPRNSRRSPVAETTGSLVPAKATRPLNASFQEFRARTAAGLGVALRRDELGDARPSEGRATSRCTT